MLWLLVHSCASFLVPPTTKLGQGYVFTRVCDSVDLGGVCSIACWDTQLPPRTLKQAPPWGPEAGTPRDQRKTPRDEDTPLRPGTSPQTQCMLDLSRATSGQYASSRTDQVSLEIAQAKNNYFPQSCIHSDFITDPYWDSDIDKVFATLDEEFFWLSSECTRIGNMIQFNLYLDLITFSTCLVPETSLKKWV